MLEATSQDRSLVPAGGERIDKKGAIIEVFMIASFLMDETGQMAGYAVTQRFKTGFLNFIKDESPAQ